MADAIFGVLLEKLITFIQDEAHLMREFPGHLKIMKEELLFMKSYLKDANNVKIKNQKETLKTFMRKLRELLYDAEDIIADCELMLQKQEQKWTSNCSMYCSPSFLMFHRQMGKKLEKINQDIKTLREVMLSYLGTALILPNQEPINRRSQSLRYPILNEESNIVGINDDSKNVINWALHADGPLTIIGIVGMGGIGKTTLAQKIYDNNDVKQNFVHMLMVVVSQSFELREIVKYMLRKFGVKEDSLLEDQLDLLRQLNNKLTKKYLVILDDVWNNDEQGLDWWRSLNSCFPKRHDGSCVIVTTRNEEVARSMGASKDRIHRPLLLSKEDSWSLFTKIAFTKEGGQCPSQELEIIGNEIVAQCGGLPLAIKVVGGMMLGKEHSLFEWKRISDHLKEELAIQKKDELVLSTLLLSYEELPMHLKPCMMCFAAFPEDFEIDMDDVIYWWIGEGFVPGRNEMTTFEIGKEWWTELISRGLLLGARKEFNFEKYFESCRVHDMVRNMIINVAKEEQFMGLDDKGNPSLGIQSRRHVSIMKTTTDDGLLFSEGVIPKLLQLRTFIGGNIKESELISKLYQHKWLRVLVLQFTRKNDDLPKKEKDDRLNEIGSLQHLNYLKIENCSSERLPDSIGKIQNLQIIRLLNWSHLKRLPAQVTSLKKLTYFNLYGCVSIEYFPMGFENLSNLQELWWFKPASSELKKGCCVSELRNLTQLRVLGMEIDSEDGIGEEELHVLSELKQLKILSLKFRPGSDNDEQKEQFLKKVSYDISPCRQLQELVLVDFPGETTPAWLNPITLPNLQFLSITEEHTSTANIKRMYPGFFGKSEENNRVAWKLEALELYGLKELEEEWAGMQRAMPSLTLLKVSYCPKLKLFPCNVEGYYNIWRK